MPRFNNEDCRNEDQRPDEDVHLAENMFNSAGWDFFPCQED